MKENKINLDFEKFRQNNNLPKIGEKIVVAMSGGVDSSVAAILLKKAGYDVIGVTMQLHQNKSNNKTKTCCSGIDISDARNVSKKYKFKHYIIDYQKEFKESVINEFVNSYLNGETPIPCIRCNQTVKFTDLIRFTKSVGSKYLATGHYVRRKNNGKDTLMFQAVDYLKDQSYFLFATTHSQLKLLRFPLGEFKKEQVREFAKYFKLKNAKKPDSQDICFIPDGNYGKFIKNTLPGCLKKGDFVDINGKIIGKHKGIIHYTVGQRKGIGIGGIKGSSEHKPLYVIKIDSYRNKITVGPKKYLMQYKIYLKDINLINTKFNNNFEALIKIRSGPKKINGLVKILKKQNQGVVELSNPESGVAPGQACVFYDKDKMIGGGWITAAEKEVLTL